MAHLWPISCTHPLQPLIRYPELPKCAPEGLPMSAELFRCVEAHRKRFSSGRGPKRPCRRGCGPAAQDCQVEDLREVATRIHAYMAASPYTRMVVLHGAHGLPCYRARADTLCVGANPQRAPFPRLRFVI